MKLRTLLVGAAVFGLAGVGVLAEFLGVVALGIYGEGDEVHVLLAGQCCLQAGHRRGYRRTWAGAACEDKRCDPDLSL